LCISVRWLIAATSTAVVPCRVIYPLYHRDCKFEIYHYFCKLVRCCIGFSPSGLRLRVRLQLRNLLPASKRLTIQSSSCLAMFLNAALCVSISQQYILFRPRSIDHPNRHRPNRLFVSAQKTAPFFLAAPTTAPRYPSTVPL